MVHGFNLSTSRAYNETAVFVFFYNHIR